MKSNGDHDLDAKSATNGEPPDVQLDSAQLAEARLTGYALGELDTDERAAVEKELSDSEAVRQHVSDIRRSVEMLTAALATESTAELPSDQRHRLVARAADYSHETAQGLNPARSPRRVFGKYALAASLLLCVAAGLARLLLPHVQSSREVAWQPAVDSSASAVSKVGDYRTKYDGDKGTAHYKGMATDINYPDVDENAPRAGYYEYFSGFAWQPDSAQQLAPGEPGYTVNKPTFETKARQDRPFALFGQSLDGGLEGRNGAGGQVSPKIVIQEEEEALKGFREQGESNTESYDRIYENPFLDVRQNPLSTFSIDVDTASYANVRRFLNGGALPPKDAVRIEEMVNYFTYHYAPPADEKPFAVHAEVAGCPWESKHRLLRVALKGREIDLENRPASNLVFLIDVSGSMDDPAKLPLLKSALHLLVDKLAENDRVAMVVYAGSSGLVLPSTSGLYKETILAALDQLQAGGSTNGGSGIQLAYNVAREKFIKGGTNRVILCTDGDFNVGVTDQGSLTRLIEDEAKSGVFLSVLGFGAGNLKDSTMEKLADRGNGNYSYIDTHNEARKVLVEQLGGTLVTIAKDVKLQLEFNPRQGAAYRLIGYENRLLRTEDFNDDKKDAGEIGAGHTVTALYELVPAGAEVPAAKVDNLKYQRPAEPTDNSSDELLTLKLRYKEPDGDTSKLIESVLKDDGATYARASEDFRFAAAVAGFGLLLRDSQFKGDLTFGAVSELAQASRGADENGYRAEFIELVKKAQNLKP